MQPNKPYDLAGLQGEVRAEMARKRLTQATAAEMAGASRTYFNRALNATEHEPSLVAVLDRFMQKAAGLRLRTEVTYRAVRDGAGE